MTTADLKTRARVAHTQEKTMSTCRAVTETASRILAHLQAQHAAGAATTTGRKVVLALNEPPASVRLGLTLLVAQGQVEEVATAVYGLTAAGLPSPAVDAPLVAVAPDRVRASEMGITHAEVDAAVAILTEPAERPVYAPAVGTVADKVLKALAQPEAAEGLRCSDLVRITGTRSAESTLVDTTRWGWTVRIATGLYKLGTVPPPRPGAKTGAPGLPVSAAEQALTEKLKEATARVEPVWKAVGEVAGTLGDLGPGWWGPVPADWPARIVTFIQATTADRTRLRGLAGDAYNTLCNLRALLRLPEGADLNVEAPRIGADMDAVRLLVRPGDGETLEAAVVRHLADLERELASARRGHELARQPGGPARASARPWGRNERPCGAAERRPHGVLPDHGREHRRGLQRAGHDELNAAFDQFADLLGMDADKSDARPIVARVAELVSERDEALAEYIRLRPPTTAMVKLTDITDTLAAKLRHLDAIRKALTEAGEPAELNDLLLAPAVRALVKQAAGLEKVAQRQPVQPGPRMVHPQEHPAVTAATVEAVGKLCCDACAVAIEDLRDALAVDESATPGEVVACAVAGRTADRALIGELRAELADTRRRLTVAACDARDLRDAASRTLGQRLMRFIGKVVGK